MSEKQKNTHEVVVIHVLNEQESGVAGFRDRESALICAEHFAEAKQLSSEYSEKHGRRFIEGSADMFLFVAVRIAGDTRNETLEVLKGDKGMLDAVMQKPERQPIPVEDLSDIHQVRTSEDVVPASHSAHIPHASNMDQEMRS